MPGFYLRPSVPEDGVAKAEPVYDEAPWHAPTGWTGKQIATRSLWLRNQAFLAQDFDTLGESEDEIAPNILSMAHFFAGMIDQAESKPGYPKSLASDLLVLRGMTVQSVQVAINHCYETVGVQNPLGEVLSDSEILDSKAVTNAGNSVSNQLLLIYRAYWNRQTLSIALPHASRADADIVQPAVRELLHSIELAGDTLQKSLHHAPRQAIGAKPSSKLPALNAPH